MKKFLAVLIFAALLLPCGICEEIHTRDDVRIRYIQARQHGINNPVEENAGFHPYTLSVTDEDSKNDALALLNFMRWLAYLPDDVTEDEQYDDIAAYAACILAANDTLSHEPERPQDMDEAFYEKCLNGARSSNIAVLNWTNDSTLRIATELMMLDDAEHNLLEAGHRRWFLSPQMKKTGISAAASDSGNLYAAFYAVDSTGSLTWDYIAWPCEGAFPAEYLSTDMPWTISLNPDIYDLSASEPNIYIEGKKTTALPPVGTQCGSSYFVIDETPVGGAPALIFRPEADAEYTQNMSFTVTVTGLVGTDGEKKNIRYTTELISLEPIRDMACELSDTQLTLTRGDTFPLTATVIPSWCDNTEVTYYSSDDGIAAVDENGLVTAIAPGSAEITARTATGHTDVCAVTVE